VSLLDVDNTLFNNDRMHDDLNVELERRFGASDRDRYWTHYEALRGERGYADYLGALQLFRRDVGHDPKFLQMSAFLLDYPFAEHLYPGALDAIEHLERFGQTVLLSDGDAVFQPHKIMRSGLWDTVDGRALIFIHKEQMLDAVERGYPAEHYVMVDDKPRILAAMKDIMGERLTTIFIHQGHYAHEPENRERYAPTDLTIEHISNLINYDLNALRRAGKASGAH
jgi:FMN phosphatase YigB (HAD superfamily)